MLAMEAISACSMFGWLFCLAEILLSFEILRTGNHLVFGLICCIPFLVAATVLHILKSKTQQLPPWIQVEQGEVGKLCPVRSLLCHRYGGVQQHYPGHF